MQQNNLTPCGLVWLHVPGKHMNNGQDEHAPDQTFSLITMIGTSHNLWFLNKVPKPNT